MKKSLGGLIGGVMLITIVCRGLSLVANQLYLSYFGAGDVYLNIYSYAVSLPNIIFNSLGTAISTVVIPIFAGLAVNKKQDEANIFASNVLTVFGSIVAVMVMIGMVLSPLIPKMTEFSTGPQYDYAVKALMMLMPVMLFYAVSYVFQGILQSLGKYAFPAAVSLPSSLIIIVYVIFFADKFHVTGLLVATVVGLLLQALILIPPAVKAGFRFSLVFQPSSPNMRKAFSLILPILLGSGAFQINMFYSVTLTANFGSMVTLLTFMQNLVLNTVLAVVYSVTAVLYPKMTKELASKDSVGYKNTLCGGISSFVFLFLPMTVGIILVRTPFLNLISGYGKITAGDITSLGIILSLYSIAFVTIALKELLDRGFYAAQNTKIPAVCGFITVGANIVLSQVLIRLMGAYGIPLAYSLASFCAVAFLLVKMRGFIGGFGGDMMKTLVSSLFSASIMGVAVYFTVLYTPQIGGFFGKIFALAVPVLVGGAVYAATSIITKNPVATDALEKIKGRIKN